jgi:hypothetical protein
MCRYDDDWDWTVESYETVFAYAPVRCEDCERTIRPGEWATHDTTGRPVPTVKAQGGNLRVYRAPDGARRCVHADAGCGNAVSHFADCPHAQTHRKAKAAS